jgi:invasion protein IalB
VHTRAEQNYFSVIKLLVAAILLACGISNVIAAGALLAPDRQPEPKSATSPNQIPAKPAAQQPQLKYSPWLKVCGKSPETNNKEGCVLTKDGRLENGTLVARVQLFEPKGDAKVLRVTVPLAMQLKHGTRMIIDQGQRSQSPYKICLAVGCMSDYPVTDDMIAKMKKGQQIVVQAINMQGKPISLPLPLNDFAKAYGDAPTDPNLASASHSVAPAFAQNLFAKNDEGTSNNCRGRQSRTSLG